MDLVRLIIVWATATVTLIITGALLPGFSAPHWWGYAAVAAVAGLVGLVLRPVLVEVSARIGWLAVLLVAVGGQATVMYVAILFVPGIDSTTWTAIAVAWTSAIVGTLLSWATTAGTDEGLVTSLARRSRRRATIPDPEVDGIVFVQVDGVPFPVLQWAVQAGGVPNVRRWLASGSYVLRSWTPQLPCTTPASQLGILHGTVEGVPAFRWYDRELGRVIVANRPADARVIEERASAGFGLLKDDGVSISSLFTGEAPRSLLTMSRVEARRGSVQTRRTFAWFLTSPGGFMRSLTRSVAEIVKERWQARRQTKRDLDPRVHRGWDFAFLRAITNGLLRDLNTALVADEMRIGTKCVYVNYVDYDEIAHHAGMFRPESLLALDGLDRTLAVLSMLAETAPRRYRIVVLSDHGQSQGPAFADRYGKTLAGLVSDLMQTRVESVDTPVESLGRAGSIAGDLGGGGLTGRLASRVDESLARAQETAAVADAAAEPAVVLGSGNLGLVYLRGERRQTLENLDRDWPALIAGLVSHPGVGFVACLDDAGTAWVIGASGRRNLESGIVDGDDPLAPFESHAARVLRRAVEMASAPDLYVNSAFDPVTNEVYAFEELVGSHGGLGGWQDHALLLGPTDLMNGLPDSIEGADTLHEVLMGMLGAPGRQSNESPTT